MKEYNYIVISDTHGNTSCLKDIESQFITADGIIHLGDGAFDMQAYYFEYGDKILSVDGNCDFITCNTKMIITELGGVKTLICHGNAFNVKNGLDSIANYAKEKGCELVLYGHTHKANVTNLRGVTLINPGSLSSHTLNKSYAKVKIVNGAILQTFIKI